MAVSDKDLTHLKELLTKDINKLDENLKKKASQVYVIMVEAKADKTQKFLDRIIMTMILGIIGVVLYNNGLA